MAKVSIIVPVYNVEKYLRKCLNSLINQTLKEIEIICINDGSTDKSLEILEEYKNRDSRIILLNQENSGQSIARNNGIKKATGEYIGFVDPDDWVDLDYYEKLYNTANTNDADIAVGGIIRVTGIKKKKFLNFEKETLTDNTKLKFELCDVPEKSYVWNKIYKTERLKEIGLEFEKGIFYEDCIFTPQALFYLGKIATVPNIYYYYLRRGNSTVKQRSEKANADRVYAHKKANDFIKEHNIDISSHEPKTYRFKIFGVTIFKIRQIGKRKQYALFNIIKIGKL